MILNKKIQRINLLKTLGGYKANVCSKILDKALEKKGECIDHFYILEEEEILNLKSLEKFLLDKINNVDKLKPEGISIITDIDILSLEEDTRINIAINIVDVEGVLIQTNRRYSFSSKDKVYSEKSEEFKIDNNLESLQDYILNKLNKINKI